MRKKLFSIAMSLIMTASYMPAMTYTSFADTNTNRDVAPVKLAITADVNGSIDKLNTWQQGLRKSLNLQESEQIDMLFAGDYSKQSDLNNYVKECNSIVKQTESNGFNGIYTSGDSEYRNDQGTKLYKAFETMPGFKRIGKVKDSLNEGKDYIVYNFGASGYYNGVGEYTKADITRLDLDLALICASRSFRNNPKPIFVLGHFPLHECGYYNYFSFSRKTAKNANKVIDVLNKYPQVVFLWGHMHSVWSEVMIRKPGENIVGENSTSKTINFTYASAGVITGDTKQKGLVASVNGTDVTYQYYDASGTATGDSITVQSTGEAVNPQNNIDVAFGETGEAHDYELEVDKNKTFTVTIKNAGERAARYSVMVENDAVVNVRSGLRNDSVLINANKSKKITFTANAGAKGGITDVYVSDGSTTQTIRVTVLGNNYYKPLDADIEATPQSSCETIDKDNIAKNTTLKLAIRNDTNRVAAYDLASDKVGLYNDKDEALDSIIVPAKQHRVVYISVLDSDNAVVNITGSNGTSSKITLKLKLESPIEMYFGNSKYYMTPTIADIHIKQGDSFSIRVQNYNLDRSVNYVISSSKSGVATTDDLTLTDNENGGSNGSFELAADTGREITFLAAQTGVTTISLSDGGEAGGSLPPRLKVTVVDNVEVQEGLMYLALGDSIGAGCKAGFDWNNPNADAKYNAYKVFGPNGEKNWDVHAVDYGYVSLFADKIGADPTVSKNGTFAGMRAKEMCYILGLPAMPGDNYKCYNTDAMTWEELEAADFDFEKLGMNDYFGYYMGSSLQWRNLFTKQNRELYKKYIRQANVITVEFGANEFNAFTQFGPLFRKILPAIQELTSNPGITLSDEDMAKLKEAYSQIESLMKDVNTYKDFDWAKLIDNLNSVKPLLEELSKQGKKYVDVATLAVESVTNAALSYMYYWDTLVKYIHKYGGVDTGKPAKVIATSNPNILSNSKMDVSMIGAMIGIGGISLPGIETEQLFDPIIKIMDAYQKLLARKYDYYIADISKVIMNPDDPAYNYHPDDDGHAYIAESIYKTYLNIDKESEKRAKFKKSLEKELRNALTQISQNANAAK